MCVFVPAVLSGIPSDQSSGTSSPLCDSGLHLNYHPNNTVVFPLASSLTDWFYNCPSVTMLQRPRCQKVVSMQLSLLPDNWDALSLSLWGEWISFPLQPASTPAATTAAAAGLELLTPRAPLHCVSLFRRTRCPARPGPRHRGCAGRRDGWTCALFRCFTLACRSTSRALTPAGEPQDSVLKLWYLPIRHTMAF